MNTNICDQDNHKGIQNYFADTTNTAGTTKNDLENTVTTPHQWGTLAKKLEFAALTAILCNGHNALYNKFL